MVGFGSSSFGSSGEDSKEDQNFEIKNKPRESGEALELTEPFLETMEPTHKIIISLEISWARESDNYSLKTDLVFNANLSRILDKTSVKALGYLSSYNVVEFRRNGEFNQTKVNLNKFSPLVVLRDSDTLSFDFFNVFIVPTNPQFITAPRKDLIKDNINMLIEELLTTRKFAWRQDGLAVSGQVKVSSIRPLP